MRADMAKVIVERPRIGSRLPSRKKGYRKFTSKLGLENLPKREPMLGRWRGRQRSLNEHLGPMRRFLRSRVGRPWNKVYSELCAHVSFDNSVQKHVLTHVFDFVHRCVECEDGQVFVKDGWRRGWPLRQGEMYVCPKSGLLKVVGRPKPRQAPRRIQRGAFVQLHWREGVWWEVRLRERPGDPGELWDVWLERPASRVSADELQKTYGGKFLAVSKRPLPRSEARQALKCLRGKTQSRGDSG
jgi:hypothetical protein